MRYVRGVALFALCTVLWWAVSAVHAGLAVHFDSLRHDVITFATRPQVFDSDEGVSVEFWIRITEPHELHAPIFTYSVTGHLNQTVSPKEVALGISIIGNVTTGQWVRGSEAGGRSILGDLFGSNSWHHVVSSLNFSSGETIWYVNGTESDRVAEVSPVFRRPPETGGEFYLGWHLHSDGGAGLGLRVAAQLDGVIDEFRIHNRVLTTEEVTAGVWRVPSDELTDGLVLRWAFDDPTGDVEFDLSGNGNHGNRGVVPRFYSDVFLFGDEGFRGLTRPVMVKDDMLPIANLGCSSAVALVPANASVGLTFQVEVTVNAQPALGSAQLKGKHAVIYDAPEQWPLEDEPSFIPPITFQLVSVEGEACSARVYPTARCAPSAGRGVEVAQGGSAIIRLGTICSDGRPPVVEITQLPAGGSLYQVTDDPSNFYLSAVQRTLTSARGAEIASVPTTVNHPRGVLLFVADEDVEGVEVEQRELRFRWLSPVANSSHTGVFTITKVRVNRAPKVEEPEIQILGSGVMRIKLKGEDSDSGPTVPGTGLFYKVVRGPLFGRLYQMGVNNTFGPQLERFGLPIPTVESYAYTVPEYNATTKGAAFSRQGSVCDCCEVQASCNPEGCAATGKDYSLCVEDPAFHLANLLGPPTVYPAYSFSHLGYSPGCASCGLQWFVVGFQEPIFLAALSVFEVYNPGSIVRISASDEYDGDSTRWRMLWERTGPTAGSETRFSQRFSPRLCPNLTFRTKWVKVEMDTDAIAGVQVLDSVLATGSIEFPASSVDSAVNELMYEPLPGVVVEEDHIEVVATDCVGDSSPAVLSLRHNDSFIPVDLFGKPYDTPVYIDAPTHVVVDVAQAREHLQSVLREEVALSEFTVQVLEHPHIPDLRVYLDPSAEFGEVLAYPSLTPPQSVELPLRFQVPRNLEPARLDILVSARRVKYHMALQLRPECSKGDAHDPLACAMSPSACLLVVEGDAVFDPLENRCALDEFAPNAVVVSILIIISALLFLAAAAIFGIKLLIKSTLTKRGPPREGDRVTLVITDIHGSTTLWDAFPDEVAKDIAIHHECLRARLKLCNGYEVATEGDSFKCAFHTPEDAVTWCILVQLDLLCAPWQLEDGGHELLADTNTTWADFRQPIVGPAGAEILHNLTQTNVLEEVRRMLADGLVAAPTFSPQEASVTRFSEDWVAAQSSENCVAHAQAEQLLPMFRGLRVRMGIHSGVAENVEINKSTKRLMYGGKVADVAKAVSDTPCGGQIIMTGESLAEIESIQDIAAKVALHAAGWHSALEASTSRRQSEPAALSAMHLGSHVIVEEALNSHALIRVASSKYMNEQGVRVDARLACAHELVEIVPWPLRRRTAYYPLPSTISQVSPAWWQAPPRDDVTIVFTFVEGSTRMKARNHEAFSNALLQLQDLLRTVLIETAGYEVEGEGGNFVCAFHSALDALRFGVRLQEELLRVPWDGELLIMKEARAEWDSEGEPLYKGLRVAVGMCSGSARRMQPSARTGKIEYYGPLMNHAARVAIFAKGGQVVLHEKSLQHISQRMTQEELHHLLPVAFSPLGRHNLKGVTKAVVLTAAAPEALKGRSAIKTDKSASPSTFTATGRRPTIENMLTFLEGVGGESSSTSKAEEGGPSSSSASVASRPDVSMRENLVMKHISFEPLNSPASDADAEMSYVGREREMDVTLPGEITEAPEDAPLLTGPPPDDSNV